MWLVLSCGYLMLHNTNTVHWLYSKSNHALHAGKGCQRYGPRARNCQPGHPVQPFGWFCKVWVLKVKKILFHNEVNFSCPSTGVDVLITALKTPHPTHWLAGFISKQQIKLFECRTQEPLLENVGIWIEKSGYRVFNTWKMNHILFFHRSKWGTIVLDVLFVCLMCLQHISVLKNFDLKHHYQTHHVENYNYFQGQLRSREDTRVTGRFKETAFYL